MTELDPAMLDELERWRGEVKKWYDRAIRQSESRQEAELRCAETTERFERACQQRDEAREEAERLRKRVAELDDAIEEHQARLLDFQKRVRKARISAPR